MKKRIACFFLSGLMLLPLAACGGPAPPASQSQSAASSSSEISNDPAGSLDLAPAMNRFAGVTGAEVLADENICYSPASLYFALALVAAGAGGETQDELFGLLGVPRGETARLEKEVKTALDSLVFEPTTGLPDGYEDTSALSIANSVWMNENYSYGEAFSQSAERYWDASLFSVPFGENQTTEAMRQWVLEKTNGLIDASVKTTPQDLLVLFNTLYLADNWVDPFIKEHSVTEGFTLASGDIVQAEYLAREYEYHEYFRGESYQQTVLGLGKGGRMHFVLPDEGVALSQLTTPEKLEELFLNEYDSNSLAKLNLRLPKFDFESDMQLDDALQRLGVQNAYGPAADFSAITGSNNGAAITSVSQFSQIAIDEEGVEVAAATIIGMATGAYVDEPELTVDFHLDRPFLFFIEYGGLPLFVGIVAEPSAV